MSKSVFAAALLAGAAISTLSLGAPLAAKEGMFTPGQLPEIADDLRKPAWKYRPKPCRT